MGLVDRIEHIDRLKVSRLVDGLNLIDVTSQHTQIYRGTAPKKRHAYTPKLLADVSDGPSVASRASRDRMMNSAATNLILSPRATNNPPRPTQSHPSIISPKHSAVASGRAAGRARPASGAASGSFVLAGGTNGSAIALAAALDAAARAPTAIVGGRRQQSKRQRRHASSR